MYFRQSVKLQEPRTRRKKSLVHIVGEAFQSFDLLQGFRDHLFEYFRSHIRRFVTFSVGLDSASSALAFAK